MLKSFKEIFNITNRYIVLATPLILFSLISSLYLAFSMKNNPIHLLFAIILFILMTSAFIAGWGQMVKTAVIEPTRKDVNSLMKEFPAGVGEHFIQSIGIVHFIFFFMIIMILCSFYIGIHFIGNPQISTESLTKALESAEALKIFLTSLTAEQLQILNLWNILILGTMTFTYFILMFYLPAYFFEKINFLKAFFISIKNLFSRKILKNIGIYCLVFIGYFIISILSAIFMNNLIIHFIVTLLNFYYVVFIAVGVFYYYYQNFVEAQLGQNIDTRI